MKMAKKAFSLVLALVMLVNVFAVMGSALGSESAIDLYLSSDKGTYAAGDEIVLTISAQVTDEVSALELGNQLAIAYDSSVIEPYSATKVLSDHGMLALKSAYSDSESQVIFEDVINTAFPADTIRASDAAAYGWDTRIMYCVSSVPGAIDYIDCTAAKTALFQIKMRVKADAAPGTYSIGFNYNAYENGNGYVQDALGPIDNVTTNPYYSSAANYSFTNCTFTVGSAAPTLTLSNKNQIKYIKNADDSFKEINVRARASINAAELQALVGVTENDAVEGKIVEAGFVYGATVDKATAEGVIGGTPAAGYSKKPVSYIQNNGTEYVFTCVTTGLTTDKIASSDYQALAYIILNVGGTQYTFTYDATVDVSPKALYNGTYARANSTYGWSLTAIA